METLSTLTYVALFVILYLQTILMPGFLRKSIKEVENFIKEEDEKKKEEHLKEAVAFLIYGIGLIVSMPIIIILLVLLAFLDFFI